MTVFKKVEVKKIGGSPKITPKPKIAPGFQKLPQKTKLGGTGKKAVCNPMLGLSSQTPD